jgi:hypothetical protein
MATDKGNVFAVNMLTGVTPVGKKYLSCAKEPGFFFSAVRQEKCAQQAKIFFAVRSKKWARQRPERTTKPRFPIVLPCSIFMCIGDLFLL